MVGHGGSSAGSYLADPTSPIPSHCASIVVTSTLRVNMMWLHALFFLQFTCCSLCTVFVYRLFHVFTVFAWEAYEKGGEVHLQADPTKLEILAKEFSKRKDEVKTKVKDSIMDKYGGQEHLEAPPKQLLMAQSVSGYRSFRLRDGFWSVLKPSG